VIFRKRKPIDELELHLRNEICPNLCHHTGRHEIRKPYYCSVNRTIGGDKQCSKLDYKKCLYR